MEVEKDSEKDSEAREGLEKEIADLVADEEDTSSEKAVVSPDTETTKFDEGVDYGIDIPTKDVKKYGFD